MASISSAYLGSVALLFSTLAVGAGCGGTTTSASPGGTGGSGGSGGVDGGGKGGGDAASKPDAKTDAGPLSGDYSYKACPGTTSSTPTGRNLLPTCDDICGASHCIPTNLLPPGSAASAAIPSCPDDGSGKAGKCLPDVITDTNGKFAYKTCSSPIGPGGCVPSCFVSAQNAALLSRGTCATSELCAPCEFQNMPTGACINYCDPGMSPPDGGLIDAEPSDAPAPPVDTGIVETGPADVVTADVVTVDAVAVDAADEAVEVEDAAADAPTGD